MKTGIYTLGKIYHELYKENKKLYVPDFQREYVWGIINWNQLWNDFINLYKDTCYSEHFMGVLVLKKEETGDYAILDGQQRISTIQILIDYFSDLQESTNKKIKFLNFNMENIRDIYTRVYNHFGDCYVRSNSGNDTIVANKMLETILNQSVWLVRIIGDEENENIVYENINATGKPLEYADLLLNYLYELNEKTLVENEKLDKRHIKTWWNKILKVIYRGEILESDDLEIYSDKNYKPLKLKKFLNALNSVTLLHAESIQETVEKFQLVFERLIRRENGTCELNTKIVLDYCEKWSNRYIACVNPMGLDNLEKYKEFEEELYYVSVLGDSKYIPMFMRVLELFDKSYYSAQKVKSIFGAIIRFCLFKEIFLGRDNSDIRAVEEKILVLDYILDANDNWEIVCWEDVFSMLITQDDLRNKYEVYTEMNGEMGGREKFYRYDYDSRVSKLILCIDYNQGMSIENGIGRLELKEDTKFTIEHMVAINLDEEVSIENYGFDNETINHIHNLILLEDSINNSATNYIPEVKEREYWKHSLLKEYYQDYTHITFENFYMKQYKRVENIWMRFQEYISSKRLWKIVFDGRQELPFLYVTRKFGDIESVTRWSTSHDFIMLDQDHIKKTIGQSGIKTYPQKIGRDSELISWFESDSMGGIIEKKNGNTTEVLTNFVYAFLEKCHEMWIGESTFYDWLRYYEVLELNKAFMDRNHLTKDGSLFKNPYNMRMILTEDLYNQLSEPENANIKNEKKYFSRWKDASLLKGKGFTVDGKEIYYHKDFDYEKVIRDLEELYRKLVSEGVITSFAFWGKSTKPQMEIIDCVRVNHTFYNVGEDSYRKNHIKNLDVFKNAFMYQKNDSTSLNVDVESKSNYFSYQEISFEQLLFQEKDYVIPYYQRRYVWDERNWEELVEYIGTKNSTNNLGTIILYETMDKIIIVDGQQRLTTLSMFYYVASERDDASLVRNLCIQNGFIRDTLHNLHKVSQRYAKDYRFEIHNLKDIKFDVIRLNQNTPQKYQYDVFSAINGKGKKLTIEEKVKNFLYSVGGKKASAYKKRLSEISSTAGFIKAFVEVNNRCHSIEVETYHEFKDIINFKLNVGESIEDIISDLYKYLECYCFIKGTSSLKWNLFDEKNGDFFVQLYQVLEVNTADALLLSNVYKKKYPKSDDDKVIDIFMIYKKVIMIYFLLYILDIRGNDKKSVNEKFPKFIGNEKKLYAYIKYNSDLPCIVTEKVLCDGLENIKEKVIAALFRTNIAGEGRTKIGKFLLLLVEYWLGNVELANRNDILTSNWEIEHICPESTDKYPNGFQPPIYLNRLSNTLLLEKDINIRVNDKMLYQKSLFSNSRTNLYTGKIYCLENANSKNLSKEIKKNTRGGALYSLSLFLMAQQFYDEKFQWSESLEDDKYGVFSNRCAEQRQKDISRLLLKSDLFEDNMKTILE